jgi:hypothetical protein
MKCTASAFHTVGDLGLRLLVWYDMEVSASAQNGRSVGVRPRRCSKRDSEAGTGILLPNS